MTSGMPELGSKISLISKADIRYEGRLFTVDPQECTIALASVRSFGTEDRETQFPVLPQNQIYDYILFRGSDIKDIRVVNNVQTMPNDPAIMKLSGPPPQGLGVFQSQAPPQAAPGFGHPLGGYAPYHPMAASRPPMQASELNEPGLLQQHGAAPGLPHHFGQPPMPPQQQPLPPQQQPPPPVQNQAHDQGSMLDLIGGGSNQHNNVSRPSTPTTYSNQRKSPTADQGTQVGPSNHQNRENNRRPQQQNQNQRYRSNSKNRNQQGLQQSGGSNQSQPQQQHQNHQGQSTSQHHHNQNANHQQNHHQNHHQQNHHQSYQGYQGNNQYQRGGWRGRGRPRGTAGRWNTRTKTTLKFDSEYDFEEANTQFEELRITLAKIKIGEGDSTKLEGEGEKKEDSGNETGGADHEPEEDPDQGKAYDKTKSFFDNISCEAVERSKGRSQRTDWRTERKLNSETFGVASARRGLWRPRSSWRPHYQGWRGGRGGNQQQRGNPRPRETAEAK